MLCLHNQKLQKSHSPKRVTEKVSALLGLHLQDGLVIEYFSVYTFPSALTCSGCSLLSALKVNFNQNVFLCS